MPTPLLATKLYIPPARPSLVHRARLIERLNTGLHGKLTLISAPAGFGKTTLISEWLEGIARPAAWLSLDESDNDPTQFLTYLVAALQRINRDWEAAMLSLLQSPQLLREPAGRELLLTSLINQVLETPQGFILVLDDYHLIEAQPIHDALTFLLDHLPPPMHLVITTREDPQLPLARLRARGQMTELRAADLRFTPDEAAIFLNQVMRLGLSTVDLAALEPRTEGWIAGLQMMALSLQGRTDTTDFIRAFTGSHHFIIDYLVEEVLQRQPERVRNFLLQSSILDRLSGPLCVAVTGQIDGRGMLETLERSNLFLIPLDDQRQWYRYHHLFADVLQARLRQEQPAAEGDLHQRASQWYAQHNLPVDALRHTLAAKDFARAAELVELAVPAMSRSRQEATLLGWLQAIPDEMVRARPLLSAYYAGMLLQNGQTKGVESRLQNAERWLDASSTPTASEPAMIDQAEMIDQGKMIVVDQAEFAQLPAWIAIYRAGYALVRGNVHDTLHYAQRAIDLVAEENSIQRGAATALLGLAYWTNGNLDAAYRIYADGMASVQRAGYISDAIGGVIALADIRIAQGHLHEAMRIYERGLQLATAQHGEGTRPVLRGTADMYVGMSELHREHDDLPAATHHLLQSQELGQFAGFPQNPYRWRVAMARIRQAQGDLEGALDLLHEAERLYVSDFFPNVHPVTALTTRVWLAQGRLGEALNWVREQGLSAQDDLSYLHECAHITLARVLLARYKSEHTDRARLEASELLARLLQAAEEGGRMGSVIEILLLQALAHQAQGDIHAALMPLQRALTLAEPEGYVRLFVDEGPPMAQLLRNAAVRETRPAYVGNLLTALGAEQPASAGQVLLSPSPIAHPLIEPLSERELAVLRLFKTELSGPEIAQELVIALSTVRTHTKSIYSKLNVNSRRAAVKRAAELDLI